MKCLNLIGRPYVSNGRSYFFGFFGAGYLSGSRMNSRHPSFAALAV